MWCPPTAQSSRHVVLVGAESEENLSIRSLAGALLARGHRVSMVVFNGPAQVEEAARAIAGSRAHIAGYSMVFTLRARQFAALAARARELGFSGVQVAGGHFAAFNPHLLLTPEGPFDAVALGEGEAILVDLAQSGTPEGVDGLVWRPEPGGPLRIQPARPPPDPDTLPPPPRKVPFDAFLGLAFTNLLGSRGCTHRCAFCSIAAWSRLCGGPPHRLRRPGAIADEMAALHREGVRIFNFHDDNFLPRGRDVAVARLGALREALSRRGLGRVALAVKCRPDELHPDVLAALQALGVFRVFLGIEGDRTPACGGWAVARPGPRTCGPWPWSGTPACTPASTCSTWTRTPPWRTSPTTWPSCGPTPTTP